MKFLQNENAPPDSMNQAAHWVVLAVEKRSPWPVWPWGSKVHRCQFYVPTAVQRHGDWLLLALSRFGMTVQCAGAKSIVIEH